MNFSSAYFFAWRVGPQLPERVIRWGTNSVATIVTLLNLRGVRQLRKNLSRIDSKTGRISTSAALRSYFRYFGEMFALPGYSQENINYRVRTTIPKSLSAALQISSVPVVVAHQANWDLAGAWLCQNVAPVLTVAEKLNPPELFQKFSDFRESLGMTIIGAEKGEKVFGKLLEKAHQSNNIVPLLADRDITGSGIEVELCGKPALVAAGPAALAEKLKAPLYMASISYEKLPVKRRRMAGSPWGIHLQIIGPIPVPDVPAQDRIAAHTQTWVDLLSKDLASNGVDWHMLQPLFISDLDPSRLARARSRNSAQEDEDQ